MADSTVLSPIQFLAGLRRISKRYLEAKEVAQSTYDAWDNANVARMEAEAAEEVDQALIDKLTAEESRLEAEMMQSHEMEDLIDSLSRGLMHIVGWDDDKIAEAIRRLETTNGLRVLNRINGSKLEDLRDFPKLLLGLNELAWPELPSLPAWATKDKAAIEAKHHAGGPIEPQPAIAEQSPSQPLLERQVDAFIASRLEDSSRQADFDRLEEKIAQRTCDVDRLVDALELIAKGLAPRLSEWSDVQVVSALAGDSSELSSVKQAVAHDVSGDQMNEGTAQVDVVTAKELNGRNRPRKDPDDFKRESLAEMWYAYAKRRKAKLFPGTGRLYNRHVFEWLREKHPDVFDELGVIECEEFKRLRDNYRVSMTPKRAKNTMAIANSPDAVVPPELCPPNA